MGRLDQIVRIQPLFFQFRPDRQPVVDLLSRDIVHEDHHFPVDPAGVGMIFVGRDEFAEMLDQVRIVIIQTVYAQRHFERSTFRVPKKTVQAADIAVRIDDVHAEAVHPVGERRFNLLAGAEENAGIPLEVFSQQRPVSERRQHPASRRTHRQIIAGIFRRSQYGQESDQAA